MRPSAAVARSDRLAAFTLIELLAVLLIMALVAGLTLPNLSLGADRVVLGEAQDLASAFVFTRQRAVATANPHRVIVDLDYPAYWIEAQPEAEAFHAEPIASPAPGAQRPIRLAAPPSAALGFQPLPGPFGRPRVLREPVLFDSVETLAAGSIRSGRIEIVFDADGTADPAQLVLSDADGNAYVLRLSRLADEVTIARE
jgi:type II secretory pathway pseudopilin PulG